MSHSASEITSGLMSDLRNGWRAFAAFDAIYKLLMFAVYTPISAWFFNSILASTGNAAVSNYDLTSFFLSPQGLLLVIVLSTVSFVLVFFQTGGLVLIAAGVAQGRRMPAIRTLQFLVSRLGSLCRLGFRQFLILGGTAGLALAIIALAKTTLLSASDIYFYLNVKPPEFWIAVGIALIAVISAGSVIVVLLVRWLFASPLMLLEDKAPQEALRASRSMVSEIGLRNLALPILGWAFGMLVVAILAGAVHIVLSSVLMWIAGNKVSWVIGFAGLLAAIDGIIGLLVTFLGAVTFASLVARLYFSNRTDAALPDQLVSAELAGDRPERWRFGSIALVGAIVLSISASILVYSIADQMNTDHRVAVTAHRGSSLAAPENSMEAIQRAIEDGADYAEIDVQETADGVIVLFHDTDLRRMAGVKKSVWEVTFEEMRQLDIGSWFSEDFSHTRVATLEEVIEAVKGRMKLNIEMKFNGHDRRLETEVARIVRENQFESECIVTSLNYGGVQEIGRQAGDLKRGLIVTATLGKVTDLDVDVLAVSADAVDRDLIKRAHRAGMEVHVWTVNEPSQMLTMIHMGVDNIMTDAPDVLVELQRVREEMDNAEKAMLYVSDFMNGRL